MADKKIVTPPWAWMKCCRDIVAGHSASSEPMPAELLPWLLFSDEMNVRSGTKLREAGITHVLSVAGMPSFQMEKLTTEFQSSGIEHGYVRGEDEEDYDMIGRHWRDCHTFLKDARDRGGKVVVHCVAGMNRSALIACAAHMVLERTPVLEVVRNCVIKRGKALQNKSFQVQLCLLAAEENLLGDRPAGYDDTPLKKDPPRPPPSAALRRLFG
uniref:Protein-serine/threonine phosphatase n=1 Tax=Odontella aurita TaxID=265563 RepID=A0A7S4IL86_9STRA|mmetsp:Transcript_26640/g.78729  ORF Transcript_26640/g.78729 Transcript_26640/m.78729 type:complete len:213 (+) Transcript_26640:172-810(+)